MEFARLVFMGGIVLFLPLQGFGDRISRFAPRPPPTALPLSLIIITSAILLTLAGVLVFLYLILQRTNTALRVQQETLRTSESRLHQLAQQSRTVVWEVDPHGRYTYINSTAEHILGYKPYEMVGKMHFADLHPEQDREAFKHEALATMKRKEILHRSETRIQTKSGKPLWINTHALPIHNATGKLTGYRGCNTDITSRRMAAATTAQARRNLVSVLDASIHTAIVATDLNGQITLFNAGAERMLGYSSVEMVGKRHPTLFHLPAEIKAQSQSAGHPIKGFEGFADHAKSQKNKEHEWTFVRKDGSQLTVLLNVSTILNESHEAVGWLGVAQDISNRKNAEQDKHKELKMANRLNHLMSGREQRITELKEEVNILLREQGRKPRYMDKQTQHFNPGS